MIGAFQSTAGCVFKIVIIFNRYCLVLYSEEYQQRTFRVLVILGRSKVFFLCATKSFLTKSQLTDKENVFHQSFVFIHCKDYIKEIQYTVASNIPSTTFYKDSVTLLCSVSCGSLVQVYGIIFCGLEVLCT